MMNIKATLSTAILNEFTTLVRIDIVYNRTYYCFLLLSFG